MKTQQAISGTSAATYQLMESHSISYSLSGAVQENGRHLRPSHHRVAGSRRRPQGDLHHDVLVRQG